MMDRRIFVSGMVTAICAFALPADAQSFSDAVVRSLERAGYGEISVSRTLLGRTRIVAERGSQTREVVLNHRTGEVMRDVVFHDDGRSGVSEQYEDDEDREDPTKVERKGKRGRGEGEGGHDDSGDEGDDGK